jgi:hypothetical protein
MRAEIEKKSSVWSQQVREEKEREYQKMVRELQETDYGAGSAGTPEGYCRYG